MAYAPVFSCAVCLAFVVVLAHRILKHIQTVQGWGAFASTHIDRWIQTRHGATASQSRDAVNRQVVHDTDIIVRTNTLASGNRTRATGVYSLALCTPANEIHQRPADTVSCLHPQSRFRPAGRSIPPAARTTTSRRHEGHRSRYRVPSASSGPPSARPAPPGAAVLDAVFPPRCPAVMSPWCR